MRYILAVLALVGPVSAASAADVLPGPALAAPPAYRPPPVSPAYNWTGFYIGAMGGYGWSQNATVAGTVLATNDIKGGFGGGTIGYNWQSPGSQLVFGLEADGAWSDIKFNTPFFFGTTFQEKILAFGSATGRVGFAADAALFYVKGGYAWADNRIAVLLGSTILGSESHFHSGWTVGGGLEYGFTPNWSAKAEYMYASYLKENYLATGVLAPGIGLAVDVHTIKAGINYRFGWGGPVVARY
jgi:outer membrane immunogenic protein